jgi:hypothetical protein
MMNQIEGGGAKQFQQLLDPRTATFAANGFR